MRRAIIAFLLDGRIQLVLKIEIEKLKSSSLFPARGNFNFLLEEINVTFRNAIGE